MIFTFFFSTKMSCNVILENYNNSYVAGQTVAGKVQCHFNNEKKVKGKNLGETDYE